MKKFEIHVYASYTTDGGSKEWNAFKEYTEAATETEARKLIRAELKAEGYKNIKLEAIEI